MRRIGLGKRNEKESRVIEFCEEYKLVGNTLSKKHERKKYKNTWKSFGEER